MAGVGLYCLTQGAGESLELGFSDMVGVAPTQQGDVQADTGVIGESLKDVSHH